MKTTGYSGTPLAKKLGIKGGFKIRLINPPDYYFDLFDDLPDDIEILDDANSKKNFIHYFTRQIADFKVDILLLREEIEQNGMIWVSCPKKSSGVVSDISLDDVRNFALANGLVDIKVCAIDEIWSGLKLVIPVKERKSPKTVSE
ncbi:Protein of unknown function [Pseudarcicella hirudinis]|uniref:DUF3052 domain-containing protein n=1 Tax=Pseudarcicella hirudinis TaxID=1079859 RepID=A0A1I5VK31_9BACT|nr:DUF3052 family protein [Pseudarcicella hirudinis]SFQ07742.1 Protein of unknown function [Pseudarcicella hirudinis]